MNTICIDPGHGGVDPGATTKLVKEKELALVFGIALEATLSALGAHVVMTRESDVLPGHLTNINSALMERCNIANKANAVCFVALHFNYSSSPSAKGFQVFYAKGSVRGRDLAAAVYTRVTCDKTLAKVYPDDSPEDGNRKLAVLRHTKMPAILIEFGFISNASDLADALNNTKRTAVIAAVAAGINDWISKRPLAG